MKIENITSKIIGKRGLLSQPANEMRIRLAAMALAVSGILFILYPAIRPFSDETSLSGAAAFASAEWIIAHTLAMLGFILLSLGLFGLSIFFQGTTSERLALRGFVFSWLGIGLTLPFYGAEVFGLHAIGIEAIKQHNATLVNLANDVRLGSGLGFILFGLLLTAVGSILVAYAIWISRSMSKWSGIPFALGFLLYIPQFAGTQPIRVAHGLLVAGGCLWMATGMWKQSKRKRY